MPGDSPRKSKSDWRWSLRGENGYKWFPLKCPRPTVVLAFLVISDGHRIAAGCLSLQIFHPHDGGLELCKKAFTGHTGCPQGFHLRKLDSKTNGTGMSRRRVMAGCLIDQGLAINSLWATLFVFSRENLKPNAPGDLACCARFTSFCVLVPSPWVQEAVGRSNGCAVYNLEIV